MKDIEKVSSTIKGRGGKRPGAGRPLGSLNRVTREIKELARQYGPYALDTLIDIMSNGESETARFAAAKELLDRGYGKPRQEDDGGGRRIEVVLAPYRRDAAPVTKIVPVLEHSPDPIEE